MRNLGLCILLSVAVLFAYACSTSNQGTVPTPVDDSRSTFSIEVVAGIGTFTPELKVEENTSGVAVTVKATEAEELAAANFNLQFDNRKYTPDSVTFTDYLGVEGQVINLSITDAESHVAVGIAQIRNGGASPVSNSGDLATIYFKSEPSTAVRRASAAPGGNDNAVTDLLITGQTLDTVTLRWTEVNTGDYNNNSEVEIADLTPIAVLYGQDDSTPQGKLVDGDRNGEINLSDISKIAIHYGNKVEGYAAFTDGSGTENVGSGMTCERTTFYVDAKTPVVYTYTADYNPAFPAIFTVRPVNTPAAETPGTVSNVAEMIVEDGPPQVPTDVLAASGESIGSGSILLSWTKSAFDNQYDVAVYQIQRSEDGSGVWDDIAEVGGDFNSYTDEGLADASFEYKVRAKDFTDLLSDWSDTSSATPWMQPLPDAPINVAAGPHASQGLAVTLSWDPPANQSAHGFTVYGQEQGGPGFTNLISYPNTSNTQYAHTGLNFGVTYEYYVVSVAYTPSGPVESLPSTIVSGVCSEEGDIAILTLTTDKKTHHEDGGEAASNISVTADPAPDSVEWSSTLGTVSGSGTSVTWSCPPGSSPEVVTITCTVRKGTGQDTDTIELYVTEETIKTTYNIQVVGQLCGGTGYFVDFTRPMVEQPSEPFKSLSDFIDGDHVVTYNLWEIWCPPCRSEMPEMYEWAVDYEAYDYYHVGHSSTYSLAEVDAWLQGGSPAPPVDTRPWDKFHMFNISVAGTGGQWDGDPVWTDFFSGYGPSGKSLPRSILFDKDGYARIASSTLSGASMAHWEDIIKQLTGAP